MFSAAVLLLGALVATTNGQYLGYPGYYGWNWGATAGLTYRSQYHTQSHYAPALTYAAAAPAYYAAAPAAVAVAPAAVPVLKTAYAAAYPAYASNQYHSQNYLGEAAYGYSFPGQAHTAVRDAAGGVTGSYAYVGADGKPITVNYRADSVNGFQVSSNALPVAPKVDLVQPANTLVGPEPVDFTPEVKAAREEHFKAVEEAKAKSAEGSRKKRSVGFYHAAAPVAYAAAPALYSHGYSYSTAVPSFYSAYAHPYAYNYGLGYAAAPIAAAPALVVKTDIKPLKAVEGTPASTYKFDLE